MEIRQAIPSDAKALIDVIDHAYEIYKIELSDLPDVSYGVANDITNGNVWVADMKGIVGGVFLAFAADHATLTNIAVDPLHAGKGIGKALIAHAQIECRNRGIILLKLVTHIKMPENVAFYAHLGWVETHRKGTKIYMSKTL